MAEKPKFVRIAVAGAGEGEPGDVYALDEEGNVWNYWWEFRGAKHKAGWRMLCDERFPDERFPVF